MKHPYALEPSLRQSINGKKAKRTSTKKHRTGYNRAFRRMSKNNLEITNEELIPMLKKRIDYEF